MLFRNGYQRCTGYESAIFVGGGVLKLLFHAYKKNKRGLYYRQKLSLNEI